MSDEHLKELLTPILSKADFDNDMNICNEKMPYHPFNNLKSYPNEVFVETGSHRGDTIQRAINAGFSKIYSMDISETYIQFCRLRFKEEIASG